FTGYPVTVIDSVTVHAPITSQCDSLRFPAGDSLKFDQGGIHASFYRTADQLVGVLAERFDQWEIPVAGIPAYRAYITARTKLIDRPIKWFGSTSH
ncbi:MAG: hypothetical protein WAU88_01030, partial [Candidatus Zixiibacteriota bacterium]